MQKEKIFNLLFPVVFMENKNSGKSSSKESPKLSNGASLKNKGEFGDFEEVSESLPSKGNDNADGQFVARVRMPRGKEAIGIISQRFGGNKMEVLCSDGKIRNCRVPGKYKRNLWLRPRDVVLIVPWEFDSDKGDVIFKYTSSAINQLRKKGLLNFAGAGANLGF